MTLKNSLTEAVKSAMKAREMEVVKILRNVQAAIKKVEIDSQTELDDTAVLELLQKQIKQRQESLGIYQANGREDLAAKEQLEIEVISQFLPPQLDEAALKDLISAQPSKPDLCPGRDARRRCTGRYHVTGHGIPITHVYQGIFPSFITGGMFLLNIVVV